MTCGDAPDHPSPSPVGISGSTMHNDLRRVSFVGYTATLFRSRRDIRIGKKTRIAINIEKNRLLQFVIPACFFEFAYFNKSKFYVNRFYLFLSQKTR